MIEEDKKLCEHDWMDLYSGSGVDKNDDSKALVTFFCKKCLEIRVMSYSQRRFKLKSDYELQDD